MKRVSVYGILKTALWCVAIVLIFGIFALNFLYNASVSYDAYEKVSIEGHVLTSFLMLLAVGFVLIAVSRTKDLVKRIDERKLFFVLSVFYTVMAIYLIVNVDPRIRADSASGFNIAYNVKKGSYSAFEASGYIHRYPHQTGLLLYDTLLQIFSPNVIVNFFFNFAFVLGINYLTMRTADLLFGNKETTVTATFLAFSFLPQFFFILFAYGLIPGFFCMMLGFYHALRFTREKKIRNLVFAILGASLAVALKQNFLIGAIAIAIYLFLRILCEQKKEKLKPLLALVALLAFLLVPTELAQSHFERKTDLKLEEGTPSILWVVMGTDIDNSGRAPGWYNGINYSTYTNSGYDTEISSEIGKELLQKNIEKIKAEPSRAARFFLDKTVSQWCEPMFQSVWSGPLEHCGQNTHTDLLRSIYNGEKAESVIAHFSKILLFVIYGATLAFLILRGRRHDGWELLVMFFIGGLLFHTIWEGKSQYVYPYVFVMIPIAAAALTQTTDGICLLTDRLLQRRGSASKVPEAKAENNSDDTLEGEKNGEE